MNKIIEIGTYGYMPGNKLLAPVMADKRFWVKWQAWDPIFGRSQMQDDLPQVLIVLPRTDYRELLDAIPEGKNVHVIETWNLLEELALFEVAA